MAAGAGAAPAAGARARPRASVRRFARRARRRHGCAVRAARWARCWSLVLVARRRCPAGLGVRGRQGLSGSRTVRGDRWPTRRQVRAAADVPPGTPLARVDTDGGRPARRVRCRRCAQATVSRSWPRHAGGRVVDASRSRWCRRTAVRRAGRRRCGLPHGGHGAGRAAAGAGRRRRDRTTRRRRAAGAAVARRRAARALVQLVADAGPDPAELRGGRVVVWGDATENDEKAGGHGAAAAPSGATIDVSAPGGTSLPTRFVSSDWPHVRPIPQ